MYLLWTIILVLVVPRGGNEAHLAPEVLNVRSGPRKVIDYNKQPVWAAGVLAYELAGHFSPFEGGEIDQRSYDVSSLPPLKTTYCQVCKWSLQFFPVYELSNNQWMVIRIILVLF